MTNAGRLPTVTAGWKGAVRVTPGNGFCLNDDAVDRIRRFLSSPIRQAPTHNINNYWLQHQLNLVFDLTPQMVRIYNDPNLDVRITPRDVELVRRLPRLPQGAVSLLARASRAARDALDRLDRFVGLQRLRQRVALGLAETVLPEPLGAMRAAWPERVHLMLHAAEVLGRSVPSRRPLDVLEIGSGPSILTAVLRTLWGSRHVNIDLPEQIIVGFALLNEFFPQLRILLPHEVEAEGAAGFDVAFITPEQLHWLGERRFDVAVNMFSFGEMSAAAVEEYFNLLRRVLRQDGIFYCANRIAKPNPNDQTVSEFLRYPWRTEDMVLHDRTDLSAIPGGSREHRERIVRLQPESVPLAQLADAGASTHA